MRFKPTFLSFLKAALDQTVFDRSELNQDFVFCSWIITTTSVNEGYLELSSELFFNTKDYLDQLDQTLPSVIRAQALIKAYQATISYIKGEYSKSRMIGENMVQVGKKYNDTLLIIAGGDFISDVLVSTNKLDEFIALNERSYAINQHFSSKHLYYRSLLDGLLNAYIYKGGNENRVWELLIEMHDSEKYVAESFLSFAQLISFSQNPDSTANVVFKKFGVKDITELSYYFLNSAKDKLNNNQMYYLYYELAKANRTLGNADNALEFLDQAVILTRKIYGLELSQSLAQYEKLKVEQEKELELKLERQRSKTNLIIATLIGLVVLILTLAMVRQRKQNNQLKSKNEEITRQNAIIAEQLNERGTLFKEMHHRVKNNFQIVTSLLEMQVKRLEHPASKLLIAEGINRVKSMAIIHKHLYRDDELEFYIKDYIVELVNELKSLYDEDNLIQVQYNLIDIKISIDTAMPLGLIVNELVTNAFKYSLKNPNDILKVSLIATGENEYELIVSDPGKGIDDSFDLSHTNSTGLKLVRRLAKQLHGTLRFKYFNGANFYVSWKDVK